MSCDVGIFFSSKFKAAYIQGGIFSWPTLMCRFCNSISIRCDHNVNTKAATHVATMLVHGSYMGFQSTKNDFNALSLI